MKLNFFTVLVSIFLLSCLESSKIKMDKRNINSSIEIISSSLMEKSILMNLDEKRYFFLNGNNLKIRSIANDSTLSKMKIDEFDGQPIFRLTKVNDSVVIVGQNPGLSFRKTTNEQIFLKINIKEKRVIKIYSIEDRLIAPPKGGIKTTQDSLLIPKPLFGLTYDDEILYFPLFRWIPMSDSSFFGTKMPAVASFDLNTSKLSFLPIYHPYPLKGQLLNIRDDIRITKGHGDKMICTFSYTDSVVLYDLKTKDISYTRTVIPNISNIRGMHSTKIQEENSQGIFFNYDYAPFKDLDYDPVSQQYWRFSRIQLKDMNPTQKNNPRNRYSVFDTSFRLLYNGVLPSFVTPSICDKYLDRPTFYGKFKNSMVLLEFSLIDNPKNSEKELDSYLNLGKDDEIGWVSYFRDIHDLNTDTLKAIVIPEYSCPSCRLGLLADNGTIDYINNHGYKLFILSDIEKSQLFSVNKKMIEKNQIVFDKEKYISYIPSFYNPRIIIILNDSTVYEEYLNPEEVFDIVGSLQKAEKVINGE